MKTVLDCKKDYAASCGYDSWGKYIMNANKSEINMALNVVAQDFAKEKLQEVRDKIEDHKEGESTYAKGNNETVRWNDALLKVEDIIDKAIKELDQ